MGLWNPKQGNGRVLSAGRALTCSDWPDLHLSSGRLLCWGVGIMSVSWVFGNLCRGGSMGEGVRGGVGVSILNLLDEQREWKNCEHR